jgi:hypothetical protein
MAKKKTSETPVSEPAPAPVPAKGYTTGDWRGHARHECERCPYSTLDEALIQQHVAIEHRPGAAASPAQQEA